MRAALFTSFISFIALAFGCATSDQDKLQPLTDARVMTPGVLEVEIQPPAADLWQEQSGTNASDLQTLDLFNFSQNHLLMTFLPILPPNTVAEIRMH